MYVIVLLFAVVGVILLLLLLNGDVEEMGERQTDRQRQSEREN